MIEHSETLAEFATALAAAQGELQEVKRDGAGQIGNRAYRYATLSAVVDAIRPVFKKHGLSYLQSVEPVDGMLICTTLLLHTSGTWVKCRACVPADQESSNQDHGIAHSYVRRYGLSAAVGIVVEDDTDGVTNGRKGQSGGANRTQSNGNGERVSDAQVKLFRDLTRDYTEDQIKVGLNGHGHDCGFGDLSKKEGSAVITAIKERNEQMSGSNPL